MGAYSYAQTRPMTEQSSAMATSSMSRSRAHGVPSYDTVDIGEGSGNLSQRASFRLHDVRQQSVTPGRTGSPHGANVSMRRLHEVASPLPSGSVRASVHGARQTVAGGGDISHRLGHSTPVSRGGSRTARGRSLERVAGAGSRTGSHSASPGRSGSPRDGGGGGASNKGFPVRLPYFVNVEGSVVLEHASVELPDEYDSATESEGGDAFGMHSTVRSFQSSLAGHQTPGQPSVHTPQHTPVRPATTQAKSGRQDRFSTTQRPLSQPRLGAASVGGGVEATTDQSELQDGSIEAEAWMRYESLSDGGLGGEEDS